MDNPGLPPVLWAILDGRLWHATGPTELTGIIADGEIKVFKNRYNNSLCKAHGAVSLMDFGPSATDSSNQFCNWVGWMGHQQDSRIAVWLEIDRARVLANLSDAAETLALWQRNVSQRIIPGVEACHRGAISIDAIASVLLIDRYYDHTRFQECVMSEDIIAGSLANFEQGLRPAPSESDFGAALNAAIERRTHRE
ncbi:MAG: hypothetical protein ACLP8A_07615 [Methylovirgula sp.]